MTQMPTNLKALAPDMGALPSLDQGRPDCGDFGLKIHRDGTWSYYGSPIGRKPLVKLFASVLRKEGDGYWLVTPVERGRIEVEDAPFTAIACERQGENLLFTTNLDELVTAGKDHPIRIEVDPETAEPRPYVMVRAGLEALIVRSVFYDLVAWAEERNGLLGISSGGVFFPLGPCEA
ncbi:DUF1285 domain-containing protein [Lacibacterium aquatile]|uniref:DUF1285 domain-containing protein n=1 Tax=Lacibacterium aquatile TaxID=1168082 RepID=A0ABW5DYF0_9PROT